MPTETMQAAWFERFGPSREVLKVGEMPTPLAGPGQVLVRLRTSGVNPSDVKKRAGAAPSLLDGGPVVPHSDGAGVIEAVGRGVPESRVGERVWVYQAQHGRRFGTAADYLAVDAARAARLPENTSFAVGACLGIPAMTAHRCIFSDGAVEGQMLLVTGGAGRVGHYAIQGAKLAGARVLATASRAQDEEACYAAGADAVVNHREPEWARAVLDATGGERVDRVIDVEFGANLPQVLEVIRVGGTIATYGSVQVAEPVLPFRRMMFMDLTLRLVLVYDMPEPAKQAAVRDIVEALREDRLVHRVVHEVELADVARAHELVEQGGVGGCVVVRLDG